jgi:hypothetical protein
MTDSSAPTFELPEPPHGKVEEFSTAGRKAGEWYGAKSVELVKEAARLGIITDDWNKDLLKKMVSDLEAIVNDLRTRGYPARKVDAFRKSALSALEKYIERQRKIERLKVL